MLTPGSDINAAINALSATGGTVQLAPGTFDVVTPIVLKTGVALLGSGFGATTLRLADGANCDVVKSDGFDSLVGTGGLGGIHSFRISDIKIDGNKANNTSGRGLCLYGWAYDLDRVVVGNCKGDGIHSEWGNWGDPQPHRSMEASWRHVLAHDCDGRGVYFNGPHDSRISDTMATCNLGTNIHAGARAGGTKFNACHGWSYGLPQQNPARQSAVCWLLDSAVELNGCHGEGATDAQCWLRASDIQINGGWFFRMSQTGDPAWDNTCLAFRIGETNGSWIGAYQIKAKTFNTLAGIVEHTNRDGGGGDIDVLSYMWGTPAALVVGTCPANTKARINNRGAGAAAWETIPGDVKILGGLQFGSYAAQASPVVTGYVTIKDAAGNTRKLAVLA